MIIQTLVQTVPASRTTARGLLALALAVGVAMSFAAPPAHAQKQPAKPPGDSADPDLPPKPPSQRSDPRADPKGGPGQRPSPKAQPKSGEAAPDERGTAKPGKDGVAKPAPAHKLTKGGDLETPAQRAKKLRDLYAELAASGSAEEARKISSSIERLWFKADSDTVIALMQRSEAALAAEKFDLALNLLNTAVVLSPDYAEIWNRRAYAYYLSGDTVRAIGDLRRVLALDPNHYKALEAFGQIMKELGNKPAALAALRQLNAVHPFAGADQAVKDLTVDVEGQGL